MATTVTPSCDDATIGDDTTVGITMTPLYWAFKSAQLVLATTALSSNIIVGYTCVRNAAVGR